MAWRSLTEAQWNKVRVHLPPPKRRPKGGRPPVDDRRCFEDILEPALGHTNPNVVVIMEHDAQCLRKLGKSQEADAMEARVTQSRSGGSPPPAAPPGNAAPAPQGTVRTQGKR